MTKKKKVVTAKPKPKKKRSIVEAMNQPSTTVVDDVAGHLNLDWGKAWIGSLVFYLAIAFSIFQIITSFGVPLDKDFFASVKGLDLLFLIRAGLLIWLAYLAYLAWHRRFGVVHAFGFLAVLGAVELVAEFAGGVPSQVVRAIHVGFLTLLAGAMLANSSENPVLKAAMWVIGILGFLVGFYQWQFYLPLIDRSGFLNEMDLIVGTISIAILFFMVWRIMGSAIAIVCGIALAYTLFGNYLPSPLNHRGYSYEQVIEHMAFGTEGIYGVPTLVSATYIFLFILFGSFMERAGVIRFFNELSMAVFGGSQGGPGKVCVASSALMGTVSGSGIANVVASGQFTIPLMKRFGFPSAYAGGVEATSSMGGQIMPPVMGAVAFIMAETIDRPYSDIVQAAIIPALLYFAACFWSVHLEAGRRGLKGLPRNELPSAWHEIKNNWFLILPLLVLVYLLFAGYTPLFAGAVGLSLTALLMLGMTLATGMRELAMRVVFWVVLGVLAAIALWMSVVFVLVLLAAMILWSAFQARGREALLACREAMADGARQALSVGLACAVVGIVIGTMTLTGLGTIVGNWMISIGKESLFLALVLTMIFSLILGMGIPTIPNYIITSSLAAPILLKLDVPLIVSHMFVFYFGIMADLTPPVALAAFAAAPMARVSGFEVAMKAILIALPGFIVPYMAVYSPELMLQPVAGLEGLNYWLAAVYICVKATFAVALWGVTAVGHLFAPIPLWQRAWTFVAAAFLVAAVPLTDEIGFALGIAFVAYHWWTTRQQTAPRTRPARSKTA
jgi:TRAP transporter 4TM/12TM fusion protein